MLKAFVESAKRGGRHTESLASSYILVAYVIYLVSLKTCKYKYSYLVNLTRVVDAPWSRCLAYTINSPMSFQFRQVGKDLAKPLSNIGQPLSN